MAWTTPDFSRSDVSRAGRTFIDPSASAAEKAIARATIDNWRSAHGFPLNTVQMTLRKRAREIDTDAIIAQRTKRLPSIRTKLTRFSDMQLARMHDIAGCRAIVSSVEQVKDLDDRYLSNKRSRAVKIARRDDYIWEKPKEDGYRGIHLVMKYETNGANSRYSGMRVEIQIRTRMQHAWATAVETVDTFTRQAIKSGKGEQDWRRFFALMGAEIAMREGTPLTPGTPIDTSQRRNEIRELEKRLAVIDHLRSFQQTLKVAKEIPKSRGDDYLVLRLNLDEQQLYLYAYPTAAEAEAAYGGLEADEDVKGIEKNDIVLVRVGSLDTLSRAFPNYFLDTTRFLELVEDALTSQDP